MTKKLTDEEKVANKAKAGKTPVGRVESVKSKEAPPKIIATAPVSLTNEERKVADVLSKRKIKADQIKASYGN